jgi:hypothetical protein
VKRREFTLVAVVPAGHGAAAGPLRRVPAVLGPLRQKTAVRPPAGWLGIDALRIFRPVAQPIDKAKRIVADWRKVEVVGHGMSGLATLLSSS